MDEILQELGLNHFCEAFESNSITPSVVIKLPEDEFKALGVETIGDRVRLRERCRDYITGGVTGVTLQEVLAFWTGATRPPPLGFPKRLEISFGATEQLPTAHTCGMELNLWRGYSDPGSFQEDMTKAIR